MEAVRADGVDAAWQDELAILWRGPLDACNYGCSYCPFAKRAADPGRLAADRAALERFAAWVAAWRGRPLGVLFTPWGEALIHAWYREALVRLSHLPHVRRVAIQTNGSGAMGWLRRADPRRLALWITWHPTECPVERFLATIAQVRAAGVACSVGAVGVPAHRDAIADLRAQLPVEVPLWINPRRPHAPLDVATIARWTAIDPTFPQTMSPRRSRGLPCRTGEHAISVDGDGTIRRCHFVDSVLGNLFADDLEQMLRPRPCPQARCTCYIGLVHLEASGLRELHGAGYLERRPLGQRLG